MNTHPRTPPEAQHLQVLKLLQDNPTLSQRQLAAQLGVSLGKANYCLRALVEKGLVKLGNFSKNPNKRQYAYILTPAGLEEKTRITLAFLKRKEEEFEAIQREIEALKDDLESSSSTQNGSLEQVLRQAQDERQAVDSVHALRLRSGRPERT